MVFAIGDRIGEREWDEAAKTAASKGEVLVGVAKLPLIAAKKVPWLMVKMMLIPCFWPHLIFFGICAFFLARSQEAAMKNTIYVFTDKTLYTRVMSHNNSGLGAGATNHRPIKYTDIKTIQLQTPQPCTGGAECVSVRFKQFFRTRQNFFVEDAMQFITVLKDAQEGRLSEDIESGMVQQLPIQVPPAAPVSMQPLPMMTVPPPGGQLHQPSPAGYGYDYPPQSHGMARDSRMRLFVNLKKQPENVHVIMVDFGDGQGDHERWRSFCRDVNMKLGLGLDNPSKELSFRLQGSSAQITELGELQPEDKLDAFVKK